MTSHFRVSLIFGKVLSVGKLVQVGNPTIQFGGLFGRAIASSLVSAARPRLRVVKFTPPSTDLFFIAASLAIRADLSVSWAG